MDFKTREDNSTFYISINDDMTFDGYKAFKPVLDRLKEAPFSKCEIEMKNVGFIDSAGLGMLLLLHEIATANKIDVVIRAPAGQVARMLELAKLDTMFTVIIGGT